MLAQLLATMEHIDTVESLTTATEAPNQADIVKSYSDPLLLPSTTKTVLVYLSALVNRY